jgi:hypothetical protein
MKLIVVTVTYKRPSRMPMMAHLKSHLDGLEEVEWVVVEDSDSKDPELARFLPPYAHHLHHGPTRDGGNEQRNAAFEYIHDTGLEGIVYNADDDNKYYTRLFREIMSTRRFSMFPVGNLGPHGVERPIIINGKFQRWDADWTQRKFPTDMAGFAFHSGVLKGMEKPFWTYRGRGGETEFIERFVESTDEVEFLCNRCTDVLVWHNELRKLYEQAA